MSDARIRSLDGLRCISVIAVVISHIALFEGISQSPILRFISEYGRTGVSIFFVISGFIITRLLLIEKQDKKINLGDFYIRRIFRILPAYYFMLLVVSIVGGSSLHSVMVSAIFMRDYKIGALDFGLAHTWSLGVEEKFYLLWPWAMIFFSRRTLACLCAVLLVTLPIVRVATYMFDSSAREIIPIMFHTRADTIAIGCLLAIFWDDLPTDKKISILYGPTAAVASVFVLFIISPAMTTIFGGSYLLPIGLSLDGIAATVLIIYSIRSYSWFGLMLNWRPVVFIGILSYSIYLWQQMALDHAQSWLGALAQRLLFALAASLLSYFFIEQPFIRLGKLLHRRSLALSSVTPAE